MTRPLLFTQPSISGHVGGLRLFALVTNTAVDVGVRDLLESLLSSLGNGRAGPYGVLCLTVRSCKNGFHGGCTFTFLPAPHILTHACYFPFSCFSPIIAVLWEGLLK